VGEGQAVDHRWEVTAQSGGEGGQVGLLCLGVDVVEPVLELVAKPAGENLGELPDVAC
jgi:hypothetical protein